MKQTDLVLGFSELKDILVQTYKMDEARNRIRLFFSAKEDELRMHDFSDHEKIVVLVESIEKKVLRSIEKKKALALVYESLDQKDPVAYLNDEFVLNGFFLP